MNTRSLKLSAAGEALLEFRSDAETVHFLAVIARTANAQTRANAVREFRPLLREALRQGIEDVLWTTGALEEDDPAEPNDVGWAGEQPCH